MSRRSTSGAIPPTVDQLPAGWRARANELRAFGAEGAALAFEHTAAELDAALRLAADELLTLEAAAQASGYTAEHLGRLVREGKIANAGRPNAPRLRRGDLPLKPGALPTRAHRRTVDRAEIARAVINRLGGD